MRYLPDWLNCGEYFVYGYIYCLDFTCLSYTFTFFALYNCYYLVTFPSVTLLPYYSVPFCVVQNRESPDFRSPEVGRYACYSVPEFLLCYLVTLLLCSLITPLPSYLVTLNSYHVTLLPILTFLPTSYPFRRLLRTLPRARYGVPSDPLSFGWI